MIFRGHIHAILVSFSIFRSTRRLLVEAKSAHCDQPQQMFARSVLGCLFTTVVSDSQVSSFDLPPLPHLWRGRVQRECTNTHHTSRYPTVSQSTAVRLHCCTAILSVRPLMKTKTGIYSMTGRESKLLRYTEYTVFHFSEYFLSLFRCICVH